jgi:peptidyl-tRNA hydrolase, PTH1 family
LFVLVPLGNPGAAYTATRHNLGRLMLQRWMDAHCPRPGVVHTFQTGALYRLKHPFLALVPGTYMNLSGQACAEAVKAGFEPGRMILLHDDKDLPLGEGRFRLSGSDGGHNGLKSVFQHLGTQDVPRLRLGIGPFERPLVDFVLGEWTPAEWDLLDALDAPFAAFMDLLAGTSDLAAAAPKASFRLANLP